MNIRQELLTLVEQLPDEQLLVLLNSALSLKSGKIFINPMINSQTYQDWLGAENDIYDELFADELTAL